LADSGALRQRRSKAHKAGDHSLCGNRCRVTKGVKPVLSIVPQAAPGPGFDPAAEMRRHAQRLIAACEAEPGNAMLAGELRKTLAELMPKGSRNADADLTGLFAALQA
jgi:hypothetical protein